MNVKTGDRVAILNLTGKEWVTVTNVFSDQAFDFRADDGFEHWAYFTQIVG